MISVTPLILAALFFVGAALLGRANDARAARRYAVNVAFAATTLAAVALVVEKEGGAFLRGGVFAGTLLGGADWAQLSSTHLSWAPRGLLAVAPLVTGLVAVLALGLAPLATHDRTTFARMMLLFGFAEAFLASKHPLALSVLWAASSAVTWLCLRRHCLGRGWYRVFGLYQGVSGVLFVTGAAFLWMGIATEVSVPLLLLAIAIRVGVVPFHSWFPRFVGKAPMGLVVAFAGPQLGVYAQLELLGEHGLGSFSSVVAGFGAMTAVVTALLGVVQENARRALAYLILSQTGLIAFGLESESVEGLVGALLNWQVLAVATSGFAMALAALEARRGPAQLSTPHGSFAQTPRLATAFLVLGFASVGFPLTLGFVAEDLLVQGTVDQFPMYGLSLVVATAINGITILRAFFYLFMGARTSLGEPDLCRREALILGLTIFLLLGAGLLPHPLVAFENPHFEQSAPQSSVASQPTALNTP